jgi:hypothetical protein
MVELRHVLEILRHVDHERPFDVALADLLLDERRLAPGFDQLGKSLFVELAVRVQPAHLLEGGDRTVAHSYRIFRRSRKPRASSAPW